jgi:parallel beta-helix repeat protein
VITIRGDNITVDFAGATMEGAPPDSSPDAAAGVALHIEGGRNIRIVNARIRGYKIGILARGTRGLSLVDNDLSYNWRPRLPNDSLSFEQNEKDEWLRYGAGAYLADVTGGEIRGNVATQGMNGLMLVRSSGLRVWNNTFSFNSGVGIGLYRSTNDTISHNRVDYNVRSYNGAGLLMYEQSSNNVVAYNSITHGGNGLDLWGGQSSMDTGAGGSNDNVFYMNDFSFAAANGVGTTLSRNAFIRNYFEGSGNGLSGAYISDSRIVGNRFVDNRTGIAIDHGRNIIIVANIFAEDSTAIHLWGDSAAALAAGYAKHHDARSTTYKIEGNLFGTGRVGVRSFNTSAISIDDNRFVDVDSAMLLRDTTGLSINGNTDGRDSPWPRRFARPPMELVGTVPEPLKGGFLPSRQDTTLAGRPRSAIIVDEWGPYDYRSPKLWAVDSSNGFRLRTLGPAGRWRVVSRRGVASVSSETGTIGDTISVTPQPDSASDWELALEYAGGSTVSPRGVELPAGAPYRFSYSVTKTDLRLRAAPVSSSRRGR